MPKKTWYAIQAKGAGKPVEISVFDEIGAWGVTASDFISDLKAHAGQEILVSINSPGGSVFDALAMYNALRAHGAKISTRVMGVAASAASFLFLAGDDREMPENSFLMVHHPLTFTAGNAEELRETADLLDKIAASLIGIYTARTGQSEDDIRSMLDNETWLNAADAQARGFATRVTAEVKVAASYDLDRLPENVKAAVFTTTTTVWTGDDDTSGDDDSASGQQPAAQQSAASQARNLAVTILAKVRDAGLAAHADASLLVESLQNDADDDAAIAEAKQIVAVCAAARLPEVAARLIKAHVPLATVRTQLIEARAALDAATNVNHHVPGQGPAAHQQGGGSVWNKIFPPRQTKE